MTVISSPAVSAQDAVQVPPAPVGRALKKCLAGRIAPIGCGNFDPRVVVLIRAGGIRLLSRGRTPAGPAYRIQAGESFRHLGGGAPRIPSATKVWSSTAKLTRSISQAGAQESAAIPSPARPVTPLIAAAYR